MLHKLLVRGSFGIFRFFDRLGLHILPKHYYTPVPDYSWLIKNKGAWTKPAALADVHWDLDEQFDWLAQVCKPYFQEVAGLEFVRAVTAGGLGLGFGSTSSQTLHCLVRSKAPPRILEIGSGVSTACLLHAVELNQRDGRRGSRMTCVEPHPRQALRDIGTITLIEEPCQTVPGRVFEQLQAGDLLVIDSSHSVKVGSDVLRIYLDIIPKLPAGVYIFIHDIFLPYLYPRHTLFRFFGWQETALLLALLTGNRRLTVLASLSGLHYDRPDQLDSLLHYSPQANEEGLRPSASAQGHFPSSIYLLTRESSE